MTQIDVVHGLASDQEENETKEDACATRVGEEAVSIWVLGVDVSI